MKYLIGAIVGISIVLGSRVMAHSNLIPYRELEVQPEPGGGVWTQSIFFKFVDPDNGNVCYYTSDARGGISCVKP